VLLSIGRGQKITDFLHRSIGVSWSNPMKLINGTFTRMREAPVLASFFKYCYEWIDSFISKSENFPLTPLPPSPRPLTSEERGRFKYF
jgi:hypothetical protein